MNERASSVLQLLIDHGVSARKAYDLVGPLVDWFDGMGPDLADAMLPLLSLEIREAAEDAARARPLLVEPLTDDESEQR